MVCYCQLKLQLQPNSEMKNCCHYRRAYFHITDINREVNTDSQTKTVKGTLSNYKKPHISGHFENKLWKGFSLPYKPIRNILKKKVSSKRRQTSKIETKSEKQKLNSTITHNKILNTKEKCDACFVRKY